MSDSYKRALAEAAREVRNRLLDTLQAADNEELVKQLAIHSDNASDTRVVQDALNDALNSYKDRIQAAAQGLLCPA